MEKVMHLVWSRRLWQPFDLKTVDGEEVEVIDPGLPNNDAGPDFFNAKIRIGKDIWAGNVEMHVKASDWYRHKHHVDDAYNSVILHVVCENDTDVRSARAKRISQVIMPCVSELYKTYISELKESWSELPCASVISSMPKVYTTDWLTAMAFERLNSKNHAINALLERYSGDWQQVIYATLARALGFGINSDAFERLANRLPLKYLRHHSDKLFTLESALLGTANFLENASETTDNETITYLSQARQEYAFFARKYSLATPVDLGWRMARIRPNNFPHRRLALLAAFINDHDFDISHKILSIKNIEEAIALFNIPLSTYWSKRYNFGAPTARSATALSKPSINLLIINVVSPILYAYGNTTGRQEMCEKAVEILQSLPPEDNVLVRAFTSLGIECPDAFSSQAMIHIRRNYCQTRKCLYCRVGHRYLKEKKTHTS